MDNKLIKLIEIQGSEMITAFQKASVQGKGTPQEVADFRENYFNKFISNYFPFPHRVTKGIIDDSHGNQSDSIDTLLIGPNHPYTIDSAGKFSINTGKNVVAHYFENSVPVENQIDFIVINNPGIISKYKYPEISKHKKQVTGYFFEEWKELTLVAFLYKLNESYPSQLRMSTPVLTHYTKNIQPYGFTQILL